MTRDEAEDFAAAIVEAKERIALCPVCQDLSDGTLCPVCSDPSRSNVICVVEDPRTLSAIEATREYKGRYHVLHGVISPVDGVGPEQLKIKELLQRAVNADEVIIATNPSVEGEATALYLAKLLKPMGVKTTRLAYGVSVGTTLEYTDTRHAHACDRGQTRALIRAYRVLRIRRNPVRVFPPREILPA